MIMHKEKNPVRCIYGDESTCFACKQCMCTILMERIFKNGRCPFYKSHEQLIIDRNNALRLLKSTGREDLIQKYESERYVKTKREYSD